MNDEINWCKYLDTVIEHMYASIKKMRTITTETTPSVCSFCKMTCIGSNCEHCFHMDFITKLTPVKIHIYIQENKEELSRIITTLENWSKYTDELSQKQTNLVTEYSSLFKDDDLVILSE